VTVTLYTRVGCHLCDDAKEIIEAVQRTRPFVFEVIDIDRDADLVARYTHEVPVIAVGGRKAFKYRLSAEALSARIEREEQDTP
jgi:glutaredoxin